MAIGFVAVCAKRTQRDVHRPAAPVATVGAGDESELVHASDESAEEEQVDECDKPGGALGGGMANEGVESPENGDHADNKEDQDVGWGELVRLEVAIDEVSLG